MTLLSEEPLRLSDVLDVVAKEAAESDENAGFPVAALDALRTHRLLGLLVPTEYGGLGGTAATMVDVALRLAREDLSVGVIFAMHCQQVATLVRYASPELRAELLPAIARGESYLASVTTEAGTGGSLLAAESTTEAGDGLVHIDRNAPIVTGGIHADAFLITALAPGATSPNQVSLVYAHRDQLQVEVRGDWQPLGMRATSSVPMRLTGAVPEHQLVGPPGDFRSMVTALFGPYAHLGWAACWLGASAGALSRVIRHVRSPQGRKRFDTRSDLLLRRLAQVRGGLDTVHSLLRHTLDVLDRTEDLSQAPVQLLLNTLKTEAAERCFGAVDELVELVGIQHGYLRNSPLFLERTFRDLRSASLNYSNDRLYRANGSLSLLDAEVRLA
ncbi:acyl-CoA dehydrogenase family protein [Streptomyces sp. NPDC101160]|uniref:acyl-CoA dehydrogenase family protein n=1 Tax=Streptomyces sp. NPDC101160 TaxID=3366118 RepID=UPI0037FD9D32